MGEVVLEVSVSRKDFWHGELIGVSICIWLVGVECGSLLAFSAKCVGLSVCVMGDVSGASVRWISGGLGGMGEEGNAVRDDSGELMFSG